MPSLPIMLNLQGRRVLIVGGGAVAVRRAATFLDAGAAVCVVAPRIDERLLPMGLERRERAFEPDDLGGVFAVCTATDDPRLNQQIAHEARTRGVLVNRCDDGPAGDFTVPAHGRRGPVTVAVDTGGASPATSKFLRDGFLDEIDPARINLLEAVASRRAAVRDTIPDAATRAALLREMTGAEALRILVDRGPAALHAWLNERVTAAAAAPPAAPPGRS